MAVNATKCSTFDGKSTSTRTTAISHFRATLTDRVISRMRTNSSTAFNTLSVYRSRFEALPSIGPAFFAEQMVKRSNNATENGHIYARGFADDCYRLGCDL